MCKFILPAKKVINLGGYIVESYYEFPFRDVVVGNPTDENIKIPVPIYTMEEVEQIKALGIIVYEMKAGESLVEALQKVKDKVGKEPERKNYW